MEMRSTLANEEKEKKRFRKLEFVRKRGVKRCKERDCVAVCRGRKEDLIVGERVVKEKSGNHGLAVTAVYPDDVLLVSGSASG